jgi:hypothetical protein
MLGSNILDMFYLRSRCQEIYNKIHKKKGECLSSLKFPTNERLVLNYYTQGFKYLNTRPWFYLAKISIYLSLHLFLDFFKLKSKVIVY